MKQFKKMLLMMVCVCVMLGCVACGNKDTVDNNANQTDTTLGEEDASTMNDATDGTGVVGEIGEDVVDGVEDVGDGAVDGVKDAIDGNDGAENKNVPKGNK